MAQGGEEVEGGEERRGVRGVRGVCEALLLSATDFASVLFVRGRRIATLCHYAGSALWRVAMLRVTPSMASPHQSLCAGALCVRCEDCAAGCHDASLPGEGALPRCATLQIMLCGAWPRRVRHPNGKERLWTIGPAHACVAVHCACVHHHACAVVCRRDDIGG